MYKIMKEFWCFCAEDWRFWRVSVKRYKQHAGSVVFTILPA